MMKIISENKVNFLIFNVILGIILIISSLVIIYEDLVIDTYVYEFLINNFSNGFVDSFMINITRLADTNFVFVFGLIMFVIMLIGFKKKKLSLVFLGSVIGTTFINQFFKTLVKRIRPNVNRLIEIGGYSFPSGHAMISMMFYGFLAYIAYKLIKIKWLRNIFIGINILVILLIGISRIYLGVHYFSDVVVGFLLSILLLMLVIGFTERKIFSQN